MITILLSQDRNYTCNFLTNVAIKLSHTVLLDCLRGPAATVVFRTLKRLMAYCPFSSLYPFQFFERSIMCYVEPCYLRV